MVISKKSESERKREKEIRQSATTLLKNNISFASNPVTFSTDIVVSLEPTWEPVIIVEFAYNNRVAASKEEYIELLKEEYLARHDIELSGHEITEITENDYV